MKIQGIVRHLRNNNISLNNNGPDDTYIIIYGRKQNKSWNINHKYYSGDHNPMVQLTTIVIVIKSTGKLLS